MNVISFTLFGIDKAKAKRHAWRIPESALMMSAFLSGAFGAMLGMHVFRHKTKHWYFRVFIPLILLIQIAVPVALWLHHSGAF